MATNWLSKLNNFFSFLFQHKALREEKGDFPVRSSEVRKVPEIRDGPWFFPSFNIRIYFFKAKTPGVSGDRDGDIVDRMTLSQLNCIIYL